MILDFSSSSHYLWALLPEIVLTVAAMVVLLVDVFQKGDRSMPSSPLIGWLALAGIVAAGGANYWILGLEEASLTGMIALDAFRVFANFIFLLAVALFVGMSSRYLEENRIRLGELYSLVLFATVGMMIFAGSRDLIVIFLGLEIMSVAVYVLTAVNRRERASAEAGLKYFLLGAFSSAFFIFGVALTFGATGSVNLTEISAFLGAEGMGGSPLVLLAMGLLVVGYAFKVAAVPFHMWTPDAYQGAPLPITAFMAAGVKAAAFASFIRVFLTAFPALYESWAVIIFWLAIATMIVANLIALAQDDVKRMLAYSSIAHAGYLLVALAAGSVGGAGAFLFYLVVYTLMNVGAFAVLMVVARLREDRMGIGEFRGLAWQRPFLAITMTIFMLSLAGFPLTGGFAGKIFILQAAVERGLLPLAVVLVLVSLVSYWYYLRVAVYMWFHDAESESGFSALAVPAGAGVVVGVAAVAVMFLGIFPGTLLDLAQRGASALGALPAGLAGHILP